MRALAPLAPRGGSITLRRLANETETGPGMLIRELNELGRRVPLLLALLLQLVASALVMALVLLAVKALHWRPPLLGAALLQGALAASLGRWLGLSPWWLPINLAFVPALLALNAGDLPRWVPLAGFLGLLLLNWNSLGERVPLYLTGRRGERALSDLLRELPADFAFIDLGSGLGGTLCRLARDYPQARFVGVESAPLSFLVSWLRCLPRRNCRIRYGSLWKAELGDFDLVYCFLSPAPMPRLWEKARTQMRRGARLVSNSFEIPGVPAEQVIPLDDWRASRLLVWRPNR